MSDDSRQARLLLILCMCAFATSISWRALDPMMPVMATSLGVSLGDVVLLASAYSLPFALMQLIFGPIGDALGKTRLIRFSLAVVAASLLLMAIAPTFAYVFGARILSGGFAGGINPVAIALLGEYVAIESRQVALGRYMVAMIGGQMVGAAVAGLLVDLIGWRAVVSLAGLTVAGTCVLTIRFLDGSREVRSRPSWQKTATSYRLIFARPNARTLMAVLLLEGVLIIGIIPFVAGMLLQNLGSGSAEAGMVIGCFALGGMTFGWFVRRVVNRLGQWSMVRIGGLIAAIGLAGAAVPLHWTVTAACFFAIGFGFYTMHNSIMFRVTELAPHARGAGVSVGAFAFTAGQGFGPVIWARVSQGGNYSSMFVVSGILTAALALAAANTLGAPGAEPN